MFTYDAIKDKPESLRAITSLDHSEFEELLIHFEATWKAQLRQTLSPDRERQRQPSGGRKPALPTIADKLLFILHYGKNYPLQEVLGFEFGMSQECACEWIHRLSCVLQQTLATLKELPERVSTQLARRLAQSGETKFGIDGTERKIQRPQDEEDQSQYYSGKKRAHTVKNDILVTLKSRQVKYLSQTYEGKSMTRRSPMKNSRPIQRGAPSTRTPVFKAMNPRVSKRFNRRKSRAVENCPPKTRNAIAASPKCAWSWSM